MIDPVMMFQEGGPFMYLILSAGMTNLIGALAFASVVTRRHVPAGVVLALAFLPMLIGVLASLVGLGIAASAVAHAAEEVRLVLMANGIANANLTTTAALLANSILLVLATVGAGVGVVTRWSGLPHEVLSTRVAFAGLLVATTGTLAWLGVVSNESAAFRAIAMASAETKAQLVAEATSATAQSLLYGAGAMVGALALGLALAAPVLGHATGRTLREAGVSVAMLATLLALPLLLRPTSVADLMAEDRRRAEEPMRPVRALEITLPTAEDCTWWSRATRITAAGDTLMVNEDVVGPPFGDERDGMHWPLFERLDALATRPYPDDTVGVDLEADAPWSAVRPLLAAAAGARFGRVRLSASRDDEVCYVTAELSGPVHPTAGTRRASSAEDDRYVEFRFEKPQTGRVVRQGVDEAVADDVSKVELVPEDETTVQELVDAVARISEKRDVALIVAAEAP